MALLWLGFSCQIFRLYSLLMKFLMKRDCLICSFKFHFFFPSYLKLDVNEKRLDVDSCWVFGRNVINIFSCYIVGRCKYAKRCLTLQTEVWLYPAVGGQMLLRLTLYCWKDVDLSFRRNIVYLPQTSLGEMGTVSI